MKKALLLLKKSVREENYIFEQNKAAIAQLNYQFLKWLMLGSCVICAVSSLVVIFGVGYDNSVIAYGVTALVFLLLYCVYRLVPKVYCLPGFYLFFVALLVYSAYSAAILYPAYTGVISLGVFVLMPILILDKSLHVILIELASLVAYLTFVIPRKAWLVHQDEAIYNIAFTLLGLILGLYLRRVRIDNLEWLRQGKIRETTDVLTGLYNRRKLFDYLGACEAGKAEKPVTGLSILDIDYFKTYNDTYGHLAGDACLKAVGACLLAYGTQHDMEFYRYGGEEFVAISHEQDPARMARQFESIVRAIEILQIPRETGVVTISQGVVLLAGGGAEGGEQSAAPQMDEGGHRKGMHFQQYLSKADAALYQAKEQGRNRTVFA